MTTTPGFLEVTPHFRIPLWEFEFSFARSSGPGGQNVNKVNSKAVLRWNLVRSESVPPMLKPRLLTLLASKLTTEGEIVIHCDETRDQGRNRDASIERLKELLRAVSIPPKKRKKTKPTYSSQKRRQESKSRHSDKKKSRSRDY